MDLVKYFQVTPVCRIVWVTTNDLRILGIARFIQSFEAIGINWYHFVYRTQLVD